MIFNEKKKQSMGYAISRVYILLEIFKIEVSGY